MTTKISEDMISVSAIPALLAESGIGEVEVDEDGEPVTTTYPEHHVNVLCGSLSEEAEALIAPFVIVPPETPFRV